MEAAKNHINRWVWITMEFLFWALIGCAIGFFGSGLILYFLGLPISYVIGVITAIIDPTLIPIMKQIGASIALAIITSCGIIGFTYGGVKLYKNAQPDEPQYYSYR
ncbi:TPA: hypothetical protein DF272_06250 [Candidatus Falkowbacteria bacterium]|nr:hypothetical protein [Candidatus Falkowbacteria bacterium]